MSLGSDAGHLSSKSNLPFIKTKRRQMHRYLRIVKSIQRDAHLENMCVNATTFRTFLFWKSHTFLSSPINLPCFIKGMTVFLCGFMGEWIGERDKQSAWTACWQWLSGIELKNFCRVQRRKYDNIVLGGSSRILGQKVKAHSSCDFSVVFSFRNDILRHLDQCYFLLCTHIQDDNGRQPERFRIVIFQGQ